MIKLKDLLYERQDSDSEDTGGVLYYWNNEVLLCLGSKSGKWNVPKGHIMVGENPLDGSVREFTEETQISLNGIPKLAKTYKKDTGGTFYMYVLKGTQKFITRINHEHVDWGYFNKNNLPNPVDSWVEEIAGNA